MVQSPGERGAECEGQRGDEGRQTQSGEGRPGEVEEVGHGEGVVADAAVREQGADVGVEGQMARGPETVAEGQRDGEAEEGEGDVGGEYEAVESRVQGPGSRVQSALGA